MDKLAPVSRILAEKSRPKRGANSLPPTCAYCLQPFRLFGSPLLCLSVCLSLWLSGSLALWLFGFSAFQLRSFAAFGCPPLEPLGDAPAKAEETPARKRSSGEWRESESLRGAHLGATFLELCWQIKSKLIEPQVWPAFCAFVCVLSFGLLSFLSFPFSLLFFLAFPPPFWLSLPALRRPKAERAPICTLRVAILATSKRRLCAASKLLPCASRTQSAHSGWRARQARPAEPMAHK